RDPGPQVSRYAGNPDRPLTGLTRLDRYPANQPGPRSRSRIDPDRAAERSDAIVDVCQPGTQRGRGLIEPDAIIRNGEDQCATLFMQLHLGFRPGARIFCRVLQSLDARKIDGCLQTRSVTTDTIGLNLRRDGGAAAGGLQRASQAFVAEERRVNPMRQPPHLVAGALHIVMPPVEEPARPRRVA